MTPLSPEQLDSFLVVHAHWRVVDGALQRTLGTSTYLAAHDLARRLGEHAEAVDHHPDLTIGYKKLVIRLMTHDAGGITERDTAFATWVDEHAGVAGKGSE